MAWGRDDAVGGSDNTLAQTVVKAVADAHGMSPKELNRPLYDVVDPDALNALFRGRSGSDGRVEFRYHGCDVRVDQCGSVTVERCDVSGRSARSI